MTALDVETVRGWAQELLRQLEAPADAVLQVEASPGEERTEGAPAAAGPSPGAPDGSPSGPPAGPPPGASSGSSSRSASGAPPGPSSGPAFRSGLEIAFDGPAGGDAAGGGSADDDASEAGPCAGAGGGWAGARVSLAYPDGSAVHVLLDAGQSPAEALVLLAEQLQDSVLESTGGKPTPLCPVPGHVHPAVARVSAGAAVWACPASGARRSILGA